MRRRSWSRAHHKFWSMGTNFTRNGVVFGVVIAVVETIRNGLIIFQVELIWAREEHGRIASVHDWVERLSRG